MSNPAVITIFDVPDVEVNLTKTQKELEYETLQKNSSLPGFHFPYFYEMDVELENQVLPNSNIPSILYKYVSNYCITIITDNEKVYSLALQSEHPVVAWDQSKGYYTIIPSNEQFKAIGLRLPKEFIKYYDKHMLAHYDHVTPFDKALCGFYGLQDQQTERYTEQFAKHYLGLPHGYSTNIMFENDSKATHICSLFIKYIDYLQTYYNVSYSSMIDLFNSYVTKTIEKNIKYNNKYPISDVLKLNLTEQTILKNLTPLHFTYKFDMLNRLNGENLLLPYNIGTYLNEKKVLNHLLEEYHKSVESQLEYNKQLNYGFSKQLELAKLNTIANNKYHLNYDKLEKRQKDIILLEYNKLEKYSKTVSKEVLQHQYLWSQLRESFNDIVTDRLSKTLSKIKSLIDKKELYGDSILDGGLCPHVYRYGEELLKHFNKPWLGSELLKFMLSEFALPKDVSGYFCKICGEQIADPDNSQMVRFVDGERVQNIQLEDPIKTLIWKEAMYIITTYIKFNPIQPTKPLVNSITNGLRDIIANEEVKLYRNKTLTSDSLKDTLNLYVSIYVYAILCAMMIANPNKIIFGREKPTKVGGDAESPYTKSKNISEIKKLAKKAFRAKVIYKREKKFNKDISGSAADKIAPNTTNDIKLYERYVLNTALNLILMTKDTIISRLRNINTDIIKQIFLKIAYQWARGHTRPSKSDNTPILEPIINNIVTTDMIYLYTVYAKNLDIANQKSNKKHYLKLADITAVLNTNIKQIEENTRRGVSIFESLNVPVAWSFGDKLFDQYTYESYLQLLDYDKSQIFKYDFVPEHQVVKEFYEKHKNVNVLQNKLHYRYAKRHIRSVYAVPLLNDLLLLNNYSPANIDLSQHYCASGERHKVGSYIYSINDASINTTKNMANASISNANVSISNANTMELTKDQIIDWLKTDNNEKLTEFRSLYIIDERCKLCKKLIRSSHADEKFDKSLQNTFKRLNNIEAFYKYYDSRCPKGELHEIDNHICIKCNLHTEFKAKADISYYDKYSTLFDDINQQKLKISVEKLGEIQKFNKIKPDKLPELAEYTYSLQNLAEWSQISGIKYNILLNIGLTEGYKFAELQDNDINPTKNIEKQTTTTINTTTINNTTVTNTNDPLKKYSSYGEYVTYDPLQVGNPEEMFIAQGLRLKCYILDIIRKYNTTINHDLTTDIPVDIKDILIQSKKDGLNIDTKNLVTMMPNITGNFLVEEKKSKYTLSDKDYANFLLEFLGNMMVKLHKDPINKYKSLGKSLMMYFSNSIVNTEMLFSKPESLYAKTYKNVSDSETDHSDADDNVIKTDSEEISGEEALEKDDEIVNDIDNEAFDVENIEDVFETD